MMYEAPNLDRIIEAMDRNADAGDPLAEYLPDLNYPHANPGLEAEPRYPECPGWLLRWALIITVLVIGLPMIAYLINR